MARKSEIIVVPAWGGRDDGKYFKITEKDAVAAAKWGERMFFAVKGSAGQFPDNIAQLDMVGVAIIGIQAFLAAPCRYEDIEPMLDALLDCVTIVRDRSRTDISQPLLPDDIEEPRTVLWLRLEVLRLHTDFSFADGLSSLFSSIRARSAETSQNT